MVFTDKPSVVTLAVRDVLIDNKVALGLRDIYYGDQQLIPNYPSAVVESARADRDLHATHEFELTLRTGIIIYHGAIKSSEITKQEVEELAEKVDVLLSPNTLGGLVIFGFVDTIEPGVAIKQDVMYRASRLTYKAVTKVSF